MLEFKHITSKFCVLTVRDFFQGRTRERILRVRSAILQHCLHVFRVSKGLFMKWSPLFEIPRTFLDFAFPVAGREHLFVSPWNTILVMIIIQAADSDDLPWQPETI